MSGRPEVGGPLFYQIRIQGWLDARWSDWFSGLTITVEGADPPLTTLHGPADQATLRGILNRIWDLNLTLVSVSRVDPVDILS